MSNVQKFYEALARDEKLQEKSKELNKKYEENKPKEDEAIAETVRFAKAEGYSFTEAELKEYMKAKKAELGEKLDESELEAVAGGVVKGVNVPDDATGKCVCALAGGGGGRHNGGSTTWGCGCFHYGQGGDGRDWHIICICAYAGAGGLLAHDRN
ncbi:MAG: Nif11 family protein [Oscillospiraceae bacterium]|nr:Nif11 family protein [Oscillospiraceae bacterium]